MNRIYVTVSGDAWDMIAKKVYGSEKGIGVLMAANLPLLDTFLFPAGVQIIVPEWEDAAATAETLPPWRA